MKSNYEPRRLPRIVTGLVLAALTFGTVFTLLGIIGAAVLIWQQVIG